MDSDVTADSLSPYATGDDVSISEPSGFGVGLLSSFPTQADPDPTRHDLATAVDGRHGHGGIRNTPSVDSFGLSPVSDAPLLFSADHENFGGTASSAKRGGGAGTQMGSSLEDSESQRQRLGNNTASNDDRDPNFSRGSLSRKGSIPHSDINTASDHVSTTTRKRPREVAAIDGFTVRASTTGRRPQPQNHPRLQSSWPFDRAVAAARDGLLALEESWDDNAPLNSPLSTPDRRPSRSNVADARDFRHHISRSKGIPPATHEDKGDLDSFSQRHERGGTQDHGYDEGATQSANGAGSDISDVGGHYSTGEFSSREGIGDNRRRWNGGLDLLDTLSVSDVSSGGVPPPPVIPAGSLPAIGTLREHFLTKQQQDFVDRERRLSADRMRRLNQVLAGHLGFADVDLLQEMKCSSDKSSPAPSHGSAVGGPFKRGPIAADNDSLTRKSSSDSGDRTKRKTLMRRLIARYSREYTKQAKTRAWIRLCRHTWEAARLSNNAKVPTVATISRGQSTASFDAVKLEPGGKQWDRQRQAAHLLYHVCRERETHSLFRAWSRLRVHTASVNAAGEATVDYVDKHFVENGVGQGRKGYHYSWKSNHSRVLNAQLQQQQQQQHLAIRLIVNGWRIRERRLIFRGWSRLCSHAASLNATEGLAAVSAAVARTARAEALERQTAAAEEKVEVWKHMGERIKLDADSATVREVTMSGATGTATGVEDLRKRTEEAEGALRKHRHRFLGILVVRMTSSDNHRLLYRGWRRLCLNAASSTDAGGDSAAATPHARSARANAMEREAADIAGNAASRETMAASRRDGVFTAVAQGPEARRYGKGGRLDTVQQKRQFAARQIACVCRNGDRRRLFRGWSRLCLHAASLCVAEAEEVATTATARATRADAMEREAAAAIAAADVASRKRRRAEMAEHDEQRQRINEAKRLIIRWAREKDKRSVFRAWSRLCVHSAALNAAAAAVRAAGIGATASKGVQQVTGVSMVPTELNERAEKAEKLMRANRQHKAGRMIARVCVDKQKRLMFRGWSRLCLHVASLHVAEGAVGAGCVTTRATSAKGMKRKSGRVAAAVSAGAVACDDHQEFHDTARNSGAARLIARVCADNEKCLLFRGWSRLLLHAACLNAAKAASAAAAAVSRVAPPEALEEDAATTTESVKSEAAKTQAALRQKRANNAITRVCGNSDRRLLFRGWNRLCVHAAASLSTSAKGRGDALTVATAATGSEDIEKGEKSARKKVEHSSSLPGVSDAAKDQMGEVDSREAVHGKRIVEEARTRDIGDMERRWRYGCQLVVHVLGARLQRNLFRGWSRLCLHAASLNAKEGASATATAEARVIRARAIEREAAAALEIAESRKQAAAVEAAVVAAAATTEDEGLGGDVAEEQSDGGGGQEGGSDSAKRHLHQQRIRCACLLIANVNRCRGRRILFRGWSRLWLHFSSLSAAEAPSAAAGTATRADRAIASERRATPAPALTKMEEQMIKPGTVLKEMAQRRLRAKHAISRACRDGDNRLLFRGWNRLCLHAASLNAAGRASAAAAAAVPPTTRAEAMGGKAEDATETAAAGMKASLEKVGGFTTAAPAAAGPAAVVPAVTPAARAEPMDREAVAAIETSTAPAARVEAVDGEAVAATESATAGKKASLARTGGFTTAAVIAPAAQAEAVNTRAAAANKTAAAGNKADVASADMAAATTVREGTLEEAAGGSETAAGLKERADHAESALRECSVRHGKTLITRIFEGREKRHLFRGWSRLCLYAAALDAAEGASAAATAAARAARLEIMEKVAAGAKKDADAGRKAVAAGAETTDAQGIDAERKSGHTEASGVSTLEAEVAARETALQGALREQKMYLSVLKIARVRRDGDRRLLFRGWSRLCLHAASLNAAEAASASSTAASRAARAEAMDKQAAVAEEKAEAWEREAVKAKEEASQDVSRLAALVQDVGDTAQQSERTVRKLNARQGLWLVARVCRDVDRRRLFRGWLRLCLQSASPAAEEAVSASATTKASDEEAGATEIRASTADKAATATRVRAEEAALGEACSACAALRDAVGASERSVQMQGIHRAVVLISNAWQRRVRRLLFRAWNRLSLHAASLNAAEAKTSAAAAAARVARADAMEREATVAEESASALAEAVAASKEAAIKEICDVSKLATDLRDRAEMSEKELGEQRLHRAVTLLTHARGKAVNRLLFRGWSRLSLYAASLNAAEGALAAAAAAVPSVARATTMGEASSFVDQRVIEDDVGAADPAVTAPAEATPAATQGAPQQEGSEVSSRLTEKLSSRADKAERELDLVVQEQNKYRALLLVARAWNTRDRLLLFRGWSRLCLHAASLNAVEGAATAAAATSSATADPVEKDVATAAGAAATVEGEELQWRRTTAMRIVVHVIRTAYIRALARGWAMLKAATAAAKVLATSAANTSKLAMLEAHAIDLQLQVATRRRELRRKNHALTILLKDDWAATALAKDRETRAAREKLARAEADLEAQLDNMAGLAITVGASGAPETVVGAHRSGGGGGWGGEGRHEGVGTGVESGDMDQGKGGRKADGGDLGEPEVFLGGMGASIGMIALQGEGARRLRSYVASKGQELNRARTEAMQWRARCKQLQRRLKSLDFAANTWNGRGAVAELLGLLDQRDRRLAGLYKDLATLTSGEDGRRTFPAGERKKLRQQPKRQAADFLLRQMSLAGEEARRQVYSLTQRVGDLEDALARGHVPEAAPRSGAAAIGEVETDEAQEGDVLNSMLSHSAKEGGDHGMVNVVTDAHELISALRSEVSALERHRQALQSRLDTVELAQAASIDTTRHYDGEPHDTTHHKTQLTPNIDAGNGGAGRVAAIGLEKLKRKRERAERRSRAAVALSRMVGTGERVREGEAGAGGMRGGGELASLAVAVERTSEVRRRAQQVFVGGSGSAGAKAEVD